jgi:uncharacterized protein (TIGR02996 family)
MVVLVVTSPGSERTERFEVKEAVVAIGVGGVEVARVRAVEGACVVLGITGAAMLNGWAATPPLRLGPSDRLDIGEHTITLETHERPSEAERRLIEAIASGDPTARDVYADFLEEHGRPEFAEYLRIHDAIADGAQTPVQAAPRLIELSRTIPARWRMTMSRATIRCDREGCPAEWGALRRTEFEHVRLCTACGESVQYCDTQAELRSILDAPIRVVHVVDPIALLEAPPRYGA